MTYVPGCPMPVDIYALLALLSAFFNGAATILIRQGLQDATAQTGYWINLVVGVAGLWLAVSLLTPGDVFAIRALPYFIAAGLIGTVGGRFTRFLAIDKVGASVASSIINLNPFISAGLAIALLGERVTLPILAGTVVIVVGTILLSSSRRQAGFRLRHLIYPFTAASCFGTVAIIRKLGLSETGPIFGAAVNMTTALIVFTLFLWASGNRQAMRCHGPSLWYFIGAGVAENTGVCLLIVALSLGQVSLVVPLSGTAPLFVLPMTWLFLRHVEKLTWRIIVGSILIVGGVVVLTGWR
ncbi:DMT family transporter [Candidatus Entotheonella palauensis]|nr:EamA family transporter [Candidatus Entotheonella palauensis]